MKYSQYLNPANVPQTQPLPGENQVLNDAGGYVYELSMWDSLARFLVLGTEGGTYYVDQRKHTLRATANVQACIDVDPDRVFVTVKEMLEERRVYKRDPALFVLALLAKRDSTFALLAVRAGLLPTGTDLLHFAGMVNDLRGWGPGIRKAFAEWYHTRPDGGEYQLLKYQSRDGWSHRDVLRLAHVKPNSDYQNRVFHWAVGKSALTRTPLIATFEAAKGLDMKSAAERKHLCTLIREHGLTREMVPTEALALPEVWEALLDKMPMQAMVRNLANMSRIGLVTPFSDAAKTIVGRLDADHVSKSGLHPMQFFLATATYASGMGRAGREWRPVQQVTEALDAAFYTSFKNVEPTGKNTLISIDVSGSMMGQRVTNTQIPVSGAAAALALVAVRTEPNCHVIAFDTRVHEIDITKATSVNDVLQKVNIYGGGTDLALPFKYAIANKLPVQAFQTFTDCETWAGWRHPGVSFDQFRRSHGQARAVNVALAATLTSQMKTDPDVLEVSGFDASVPRLVSDFVARKW